MMTLYSFLKRHCSKKSIALVATISMIVLVIVASTIIPGCSSNKVVTARAIEDVYVVQHDGDEIVFDVIANWPDTCGEFSHFEVDRDDHNYTIELFVKTCKNCGCGDEIISISSDLKIEVPEPGQYNFHFVSDSRYFYNESRFDWQLPMGDTVNTVEFADQNLENAVREQLIPHDRDLYPFELEKITMITSFRSNIRDLSGLEYCVNLSMLNLMQNDIEDIYLLANLLYLEDINLSNNEIVDISPLRMLPDISVLNLERNSITDISPLLDNPGLIEGTAIHLRYNPLNAKSIEEYIPQLANRGVKVLWE